ncbi:MAG: hypothetical protein EOO65_00480 [Methanosarcinales archaeon]|nr:MAG: hypothetical protein EOO65_00480 [Methanosarcinales archaeon]
MWRPLAGTALTAITLLAALVAGEEIVRQNHINFKSADLPADTGDMSVCMQECRTVRLIETVPCSCIVCHTLSTSINLLQDLYYTKPWARCPPYLLGILLAFLYYRHAQRKMAADKLAAKQAELLSSTTQPTSDVHSHSVSNKNASAAPWSPFPTVWWSWLLWACALVLMGVIFYVGADSYSTPTRAGWSTGSIVFYTAFSRTLWSAGLGCMLYLCFIGEGGAIGAFLSWKVWEPLAKLTFGTWPRGTCGTRGTRVPCVGNQCSMHELCMHPPACLVGLRVCAGAYIMHPVIISVVYMRSTQPLYFDYYTIFTLFYGFSALSYMAAAALFVSVEVPLAQVEKYFIRPLLGVAPTHQHHAPPPPHKAHAESQCTPLCKVAGVTSLNTQYEPLASVLTMNPSSSAATDDWRRSRDVQPNASLSTPFLPA